MPKSGGDYGKQPVYLLIMIHVEGDEPEPEGSPTCGDLTYQEGDLPLPGIWPAYATFEIDLAGTELIFELMQQYTDSTGHSPKLFIEPVGSFWHTESDPHYGNKLFRKYDYLAAGYEFGIQGHNILYSGKGFCWNISPSTQEGIRRKFEDMHQYAERVYYKDQKVNTGLTYTGGHKLLSPPLDPIETEAMIDHVAYNLGYRISIEDRDGHWQNKPEKIDHKYACPYAYEADYGDGVRIFKIDFNGMISADSPVNSPRSETPEEALARFDRVVASQNDDQDPLHLYFFATTFHANMVWIDFNLSRAGLPMIQEGAGLKEFFDGIELRKQSGVEIQFITPSEFLKLFEQKKSHRH